MSFDDHFYRVPYTLVCETLRCRATEHTIELIHQGKRITTHARSVVKYAYSTHPEHCPASHRAHLEWTPSRLIDWGTWRAAVVEHVIRSKPPCWRQLRKCKNQSPCRPIDLAIRVSVLPVADWL